MHRSRLLIIFRIGWPCVLAFLLARQYLPSALENWLNAHNERVFIVIVIISLTWLISMIHRERSDWDYVRPIIKFVLTRHSEHPAFEIKNGRRLLKGVSVSIDGYFENSGSLHGRVRMEIQLRRRAGKLVPLPGWKCKEVAFGPLDGSGIITEEVGYFVKGDTKSPVILANGTCWSCKEFRSEKLSARHVLLLVCKSEGREIHRLVIAPDWDAFRTQVQYAIQRPILGKEGFEIS